TQTRRPRSCPDARFRRDRRAFPFRWSRRARAWRDNTGFPDRHTFMFEAAPILATDKPDLYAELAQQALGLLHGETNLVANAANFAALVYHALPDINWCGFYSLKMANWWWDRSRASRPASASRWDAVFAVSPPKPARRRWWETLPPTPTTFIATAPRARKSWCHWSATTARCWAYGMSIRRIWLASMAKTARGWRSCARSSCGRQSDRVFQRTAKSTTSPDSGNSCSAMRGCSSGQRRDPNAPQFVTRPVTRNRFNM